MDRVQNPNDAPYLPRVYTSFRERFSGVAEAFDHLGETVENAGPLDVRSQRLATLGIAIGALAKGAVKSNVRKALNAGVSPDEIRHTAVLAITTRGFPTAIAALEWIDDVLEAKAQGAR